MLDKIRKLGLSGAIAALIVIIGLGADPAQVSNATPTTTEIANRITALTGLQPDEIDAMYAAEQRIDIVLIASDITIPIVLEPRTGYLLVRVGATQEWIRVLIDQTEWENDFRPYLEAQGVTIHEQPVGTIDQLTPAQEAANIAASGSISGEAIANIVLHGSPAGPSGAVAPVPQRHNEPDPGASSVSDQIGTIQGQFRVNESGAATYSIPIAAPAGSGGVAPNISLNYSSASANGIAGLGWSVGGLSAISRCRSTLGQDNAAEPVTWTNTDQFCLDGQRLIHTTGVHGEADATYRTEIDGGTLVTVVGELNGGPDYFKVQRKDGSTSYYGKSPNSTDTTAKLNNGSGQTLTWSIRHFTDSAGNPVWFDYEVAGSAQRISNIKYAYGANKTNPAASHGARITFSYDPRQDPISGYVAGHLFVNDRRLARIEVHNTIGTELAIRQYDLAYDQDGNVTTDSLSRLISVEERLDNTRLPKTVFSWRLPEFTAQYETTPGFTMATGDQVLRAYQPADIDGDGMLDLVWIKASNGGLNMQPRLNYAISNGSDFQRKSFASSGAEYCSGTQWEVCLSSTAATFPVKLETLDFNADGRSDVAVFDHADDRWRIYLSEPQGDGSWKLSATSLSSPTAGGNMAGRGTSFIDVNSDGLVDAVTVESINSIKVRYMQVDPSQTVESNRYYRFGPAESLNIDVPFDTSIDGWAANYTSLEIRGGNADFNGDGRTDFMLIGQYHTECEFENPNPSSCPSDGNVNSVLVVSGPNSVSRYADLSASVRGQRIQILDMNSDGLADIAFPSSFSAFSYQLNRGDGSFEPAVLIDEPTLAQNAHGYHAGPDDPQFVDWNMDGYPDLVWKQTDDSTTSALSRVKIRYWNANTRAYDPVASVPWMPLVRRSKNQWVMFADMNGDGSPEMAQFNMDAQGEVTVQKQVDAPGGSDVANRGINRIDTITNGFGAATVVTYEPLSDTSHYERLNVDTTTGVGEFCESLPGFHACFPVPITIAQPASFYRALNGDWELPDDAQTLGKYRPVLELNGPMYVVTRVEGDAPAADVIPGNVDNTARSAIRYYYGQGKIQASGRGMLGFQRLKTVDEQTGVETTTFYRQDWPFIGYPRKTEARSAAGHLLSQSVDDWTFVEHTSNSSTIAETQGTAALGPVHPVVSASTEFTYDLLNDGASQGTKLSETVTTTSYYPGEGNPNVITVTNKDGTGATVKSTETDNDYFDTPGLPLREARVSQTVVTTTYEGQQHPSRTSQFTYYDNGTARGLLETETIEPGKAQFSLTTTHSYDEFGNRVASSRQGGGVTRCSANTVDYDVRGRYVDETFDCLGRKTTEVMARNRFGSPTQLKTFVDVSGSALITDVSHGALGREYFRRLPNGSFTTSYLTSNTTNCPAGTVYKSQVTTGGGPAQEECYDKLARPIRTLTQGFDGAWDAQDTEYDRLGRVVFKSEPYDLAPDPSLWTRMYYDRLGRVVLTILPDNSDPKVAYNGLSTTYTNALDHTKTEVRNVLGEVTDVYDNLGGHTQFWYDYQGNLRLTEDNAGNTTVVINDLLGRKEEVRDPNKGTWTYGYNNFGELTLQTNANGHSTAITYDGLGRMETRIDTCASEGAGGCAPGSQTEGSVVWTYDTATYGLGQFASVTDTVSGYTRTNAYDNLGRNSVVTTTFDGGSYYEKTTYDQFGRVFQVFDAGGDGSFQDSGVQHAYNAAGYLESLGDAIQVDGAPRTTYRQITSMNARGQVTGEVLGNGVITMRQHSLTTGRITGVSSTGLGGEVQDLRYHWDSVGNLKYRHDYSGTKTLEETFDYDDLNRLWRYQVAGETAVTVTYDPQHIGNIESKSDVGAYGYGAGGAGPHAVTSAGGETYTYDDNGNNVTGDGRTADYTTFDKPHLITRAGHSVTFAYAPDRSRYRRVDVGADGTTTTRYIGSVEIIDRPNNIRERKRHIAGVVVDTSFYDAGSLVDKQTYYLHKDHLGSLDVMTNTSGHIVSEFSFDAWGQRRNASDWTALSPPQLLSFDHSITTRGFTSHEMLDEVGVIHMNGRIYDAKLGRFLQADIQVQFPTDSQSHNRYSYAHNNPLAYTDSSGYGLDVFDVLKILAGFFIAPICLPCAAATVGQLSFMQTVYYGGSFEDALISGISSAALTYVGGNVARGPGFGFNIETLTFSSLGGITSTLQGGRFGHGFISSGAGGLAGEIGLGSGGGVGAAAGRTVVRSVVAGTISQATGGKFANGAIGAAFSSVLGETRPPPREMTALEKTNLEIAIDIYEPQNESIDGFRLEQLVTTDSGLQAGLYVNEEGTYGIVGYAGTNGAEDWPHNIAQAFGFKSAQYKEAMVLAKAWTSKMNGNIHFAGHSLGGGLAISAAIMTGKDATAFNAAGVHLRTVGWGPVGPSRITHVRSAFDVLQAANMFTPARSYGEHIVVDSGGYHGREALCKATACRQ